MFFAWPEIESFHNIRKFVQKFPQLCDFKTKVNYRAKVKLHGTNAAVRISSNGDIVAQSRSRDLDENFDNVGFAKWVKSNEQEWKNTSLKDVIVFGEWCGQGVQKGVAVSEIGRRIFAVFAVVLAGGEDIEVRPEFLQSYFANMTDVFVLPWFGEEVSIDWLANEDVLTKSVDEINDVVRHVEENDSWIEKTFGVKGTGEGLVYYPVFDSSKLEKFKNFTNFVFKAKGEKHKNISTAKPASINPESAKSISDFADLVLTEARLLQGAQTVNASEYSTKCIGQFIGWVMKDVLKETSDELEASSLTWKQVEKTIQTRARNWYISKTQAIL